MSEKIVTAEVVRCSDSLNKKMAMWRASLCGLPREFIDFHAALARKELQRIISVYGVSKASEPRLVDGGWGDGMKVIEVSVDTLKGRRVKLTWYPGAVQQGFFKCSEEYGGSAILFERDLELQKEKCCGHRRQAKNAEARNARRDILSVDRLCEATRRQHHRRLSRQRSRNRKRAKFRRGIFRV